MKHLLFAAAVTGLFAVQTHAQVIQVRTYPVLSEDSFVDLPSENRSMGRVNIALRDPLADGFSNPAMLMSGTGNYLFALPRFSYWSRSQHTESNSGGNFRTSEERAGAWSLAAPAGGVLKSGGFALSAMGGYQFQRSNSTQSSAWSNSPQALNYDYTVTKSGNYPLHLGAASEIPGTGIAIGASATYIGIGGVDGLQFLYPSSTDIKAEGGSFDVRAGVAGRVGPGDISLNGGRQEMGISHTVTFEWDPTIYNEDKSATWYAQAGYRIPLSETFDLGVAATGNWRTHPKIPEYPIAGIPRDPGTTWAYDFGAGMSWHSGPATFAMEYVIEPVDCKTWVNAERDWKDRDGNIIVAKGAVEQRNNYKFLNHIVRAGVKVEPDEWLALRFGTEARINSYDHDNINYVNRTSRRTAPSLSWSEIAFSTGLDATCGRFRVMCEGEVLMGRGLLEREQGFLRRELGGRFAADYLLVPTEGLRVHPVPVFTSRLTVAYQLD
jgi:hypothetical protein